MLRSLMTAVTGVRAHQTMLDVTGNNIANANTTGFKKDATIFADLMYQANKYASGSGDARGGVNPAQVGLGVSVSAIETIHTQGSGSFTGNASDMMIQDKGFFVYQDGNMQLFSRSGALVLDNNSDMVMSGQGYRLQGYKMESTPLDGYQQAADLSTINIPLGQKIDAKATTRVDYQCNLDSRTSAYLPYGFADIPYNAVAGHKTSSAGYAVVPMNGTDYEMKFETDLTSTDGKGYLKITLSSGGTETPITFDMTGIDEDTGLPILTTTAPTGGYTFPGSTNQFVVDYDDETGTMKIKETGTGAATLFTYNLKSNMKYTSFTLDSTTGGDPIRLIAEFDESASNTGSDLSKTSSNLTIWFYEETSGTGSIKRMDATVYFNPDGSFDTIEWADGATPPTGYTITGDTANFKIDVGSSSSASTKADTLNFKVAKNLNTPGTSDGDWKTQGTIYQGGYHATKMTIYDDNGKDHTLEVTFKKLTENRWRWEAFLVEQDEATGEDKIVNIIPDPRTGEIEFDGSGRISNVIADSTDSQRRGDGNDRYPNAEVEITIPFSLNGQPNSSIVLNFGGGVGSGGSALEGVTQFASETTTKPVYQDGYTMGVLKSYSVAQDGVITGSYDNGVNIPLYRVALATFANEQGLEKVGNTMFKASVNSGNANIDGATTNGKGSIMSQYVEMSNVDLTEEFTKLIIAQRGFQANARTVTVSDQILEEVVNLKR